MAYSKLGVLRCIWKSSSSFLYSLAACSAPLNKLILGSSMILWEQTRSTTYSNIVIYYLNITLRIDSMSGLPSWIQVGIEDSSTRSKRSFPSYINSEYSIPWYIWTSLNPSLSFFLLFRFLTRFSLAMPNTYHTYIVHHLHTVCPRNSYPFYVVYLLYKTGNYFLGMQYLVSRICT